MKSYPRIAQRIYNEPWLIEDRMHETIQRVFEAHLIGESKQVGLLDDFIEPKEEPRIVGNTQIIPVHGILGKHLSAFETSCGGCSVDEVSKMIDQAESNWQVRQIVFDFRSPGGNAQGIPEIGNKIANMKKATTAFTDSDCCSGAYWMAAQCDQILCTESADLGSIGVYSIYTDRSKQLEELGVKVNAIVAGDFKIAGASFKPMTPEERSMLLEQVEYLHQKFQVAVNDGRKGAIDIGLMEGQVFYGDQAVENGFADRLVDSIEDILE
jgi:signal peptide peptidase SppA